MAGNNTKIIFDVQANIDQLRGAASEIEKAFSKLNLPQNIQKSFTGTFDTLTKEIREFEVAAEKGFETLSDVSKGQRSLDKISDSFAKLKLLGKDISGIDMKKLLPDSLVDKYKKLQDAMKQVEKLQSQDNSKQVEKATTQYERQKQKVEELRTKLAKLNAENSSKRGDQGALGKQLQEAKNRANELVAQMQKLEAVKGGTKTAEYKQLNGDLTAVNNTIKTLSAAMDANRVKMADNKSQISGLTTALQGEEATLTTLKQKLDEITAAGTNTAALQQLRQDLANLLNVDISKIPNDLNGIKAKIEEAASSGPELEKISQYIKSIGTNAETAKTQVGDLGNKFDNEVRQSVTATASLNSEMDQLKTRLGYFFSIVNGVQLFKQAIRSAYDSVKDLDAAMTEMAVVTKYSIGDLWQQMPQYAENANKLGATTLDVYKSMVLYTQQGLSAEQAQELSNQTLKMARIAGMEAADATDAMTSALRGFNMELTEASGQRVNDVYSNLAAHAAANTEEISNAMMRTASIAHGAGMEFETTAAFLTQMIETTREPAENLGTAMKTIIARFTEMKKAATDIINVDGEEISVNKVDAALKSVGVSLKNTNGEFRDLDDVFLELASKWDSLDIMSQRYVATMAAGSRQQSRFIAMMSDYQRTMELTGYATNSAGASNTQFEKTMESLESKLNRLHNAWEEFTTGIANSSMIKGAVDLLTSILTVINKVTDALDPLHTGLAKVLVAIFAFKGGKKILTAALGNIGVPLINKMGKNGEKAGLTFVQKMSAKMAKFNPNNIEALKNAGTVYAKQATDLNKVSLAYKEYAAASRVASAAGATEADISNERLKAAKLQQTLMDNLNGSERQQALLRMQNASATELEASAEEYAERAKKSNATSTVLLEAAEKSENTQNKMGLVTRLKYIAALLFGNQEKRLAAMQALGLASAEEIQAMATEGATAAQTSFNAALYSCPLVWLIALVAAAIAIIALFVNAIKNYESEEEKRQARIKTLNDLVEESKNRANEAKEAFDNFLENRGTYNQLKDEIQALVVGSDQFIAKLNEINALVNNILEDAPELGQYVTYDANGVAILSPEGWEKYSTILKQKEQKAKIAESAYKLALNAEELTAASSNYENTAKWDVWENLDNGNTKKTGTFLKDSYYKKVDEIIDTYGDKFLEVKSEDDLPSGYKLLYTAEGDSLGVPQEAYDALAYTKKNYSTYTPTKYEQNRGATSGTTLSGISPSNKENGDTQLTSGTILRAIRSREAVTTVRNEKREEVSNAYKAASAAYLMDKQGLSEDLATVYSDIISKRVSDDLEAIDTEIKNTESDLPDDFDKLKNQYEDLFKIDYNPEDFGLDEDSDEDDKIKALKAAIAADQVISKRLESDWNAIQQATKDYNKFDDALYIASGKVADYADKELISALLGTASAADYFGKELSGCAEVLGKTTDELQTDWQAAQESARQLVSNGASLFGINTVSRDSVEAGVKQGYKFSGKGSLIGSAEYNQAVEDAYEAANQGVAEFTKKIGPDLAVKFGNLAGDWLSQGFKADSIFKDFQTSDILKDAESATAFYNEIKDINFSTPIQAASKIKTLAKDTNKEYVKAGKLLEEEAASLINSQKQVAQLYNEIDSDTWKDLLKDSKVTREEVDDLKDTLPDVITFLDNTGVSSETLAKYLSYVSSGMLDIVNTSSSFIEALDLVNFATNNVNDSLNFVENFKTSTTQTKIGDNFSDWRDEISQALERGQYGDQALIDYSKMILGNDNWDKYYAEFEGNLQKVEELAQEKIELWGENFYGLWQSFAGQNSLASLGSDGAISLDMSQISSLDDIKKALMDTFDISEEVAEAAIADAQTYSNDFSEAIKQFSLGESLATLLSGSFKIDNNTRLINEEELQILADEAGQDIVDLKNAIEQAAVDNNLQIKFSTEPILEANGSIADELAQQYADTVTEGLKDGIKNGLNGANLDQIYTKMLEAGLSEEQIKASFSKIMSYAQKSIDEHPLSYADNGTANTVYYYLEKGILKVTTSEEVAKSFGVYASNLEEAAAMGMLSGLQDEKVRKQEELTALEEEKQMAKATAVGLEIGFTAFLHGGKINEVATTLSKSISAAIDNAYKDSINGLKTELAELEKQTGDDDTLINAWTNSLNEYLNSIPTTVTFYTNSVAQDAGISGGSWPDDDSSSSDSNDDDDNDWTNDWNMEYAILKKIAALERERNKLDKEHSRWVNSYALKEEEITKNKEKQRQNLMDQIDLNEDIIQRTKNELETLNWNSGFGGSIWFDQENNIIRTDDAHIRAMDEDTKEAFDDVKTEYENLASQLETAQDNIESAVEAIEELTAKITEIDYQTQIEKLIEIIDNTLSLYEKAEQRLSRSDRATTSQDITDLYKAQSEERVNKSDLLTESYIRSGAQLNALLNMGDYSKYYDFDWDTGTLKRNSAYYSIVDQDILDKVDTHLEKIESLAEQRRDADTERITLQDDQYEAEKDIADRANEWQQKVYDAVVKAREDEISSLENINTSIQNSASKLVDSIQKNIQRLRQNRKNNKTEEELANMQAKMAYLQVDTSTGNQVEIKKLQKQLDEKQESYTDSLIDQKITELQDQNKEAAEQRQKQIDIMKAQLSYDKQYGVLWGEVRSLIAAGIMSNGRINSNSELYKTLANWGSVDSLNAYKKKEFWAEQNYGAASYDANTTVSKSNYQDQLNYQISSGDYNSLYKSMADEVKTALSREVNETTPYKNYMHYNRSKNVLEQTELFPHPDDNLALHDTLQAMWSSVWERINYINGLIGYFDVNSSNTLFSHIPTLARYASGGLADFTGPAWLDGTTSEPEMVLNAKDTKNFIALKDILGAVLKNNNIESSKNGDFYCDIHINVEEIANDYDVERLAEELKRQIANDARYRNVNTINMIR